MKRNKTSFKLSKKTKSRKIARMSIEDTKVAGVVNHRPTACRQEVEVAIVSNKKPRSLMKVRRLRHQIKFSMKVYVCHTSKSMVKSIQGYRVWLFYFANPFVNGLCFGFIKDLLNFNKYNL